MFAFQEAAKKKKLEIFEKEKRQREQVIYSYELLPFETV